MDKDILWYGAAGVGLVVGLVYLINWLDSPSLAELENIKKNLPVGCEFKDLGSYGNIDKVVMVNCVRNNTTSTIEYDRHGKTSTSSAKFAIN